MTKGPAALQRRLGRFWCEPSREISSPLSADVAQGASGWQGQGLAGLLEGFRCSGTVGWCPASTGIEWISHYLDLDTFHQRLRRHGLPQPPGAFWIREGPIKMTDSSMTAARLDLS